MVVASGACNCRDVPAVAAGVPSGVTQLTASSTATPASCRTGGVLVVGASSSGVQIADELMRDGRPVTIAVGEHVRLPRRYRGADILWWMDRRPPRRAATTRSTTSVRRAQHPVDCSWRARRTATRST